ncbi:MAG: LuxR C-terminal-related transcriptional regulator [Sphingobacteriaceae bacterium]
MSLYGIPLHPATFTITLIEVIFLYHQTIIYRSRPQEKKRFWQLILLALMILCNVVQGLFQEPNPNWPISLIVQNSIGQGFGYVIASYFPLYWYRTLGFKHLRFHGKYGFLFLLAPIVCVYGIFYPISQDIMAARKYVYVIPFFYGSCLIWQVCKSTLQQYRRDRNKTDLHERLLIVMNVVPWMSVPFIGIGLGQPQWVLDIVLNSFFIISNGLFIRQIVKKTREAQVFFEMAEEKIEEKVGERVSTLVQEKNHQKKAFISVLSELKNLNTDPSTPILMSNCKLFKLTPMQIDVVQQLNLGYSYQTIADNFGIEYRSVESHMRRLFKKVKVHSRPDLLEKLNTPLHEVELLDTK